MDDNKPPLINITAPLTLEPQVNIGAPLNLNIQMPGAPLPPPPI